SADLDNPGCFDEVFKGCNGVAHISHVSGYNDPDYIQRTCDHIIASINGSGSVTRVVVTSSIAAVISEMDLQEIVRPPVFYEDRLPDHQADACRPWRTREVRDDALCHIGLLESAEVWNGERYIAWSTDTRNVE